MRSITNANATIAREYFNDNLFKSETETVAGGGSNTVIYDYDVDGQRGNIIYPSGKNYSYGYTGRNDLWYVKDNISGVYQVSYFYGENGNVNLTKRYVGQQGIVTDLSQRDGLNRVTHLEHRLVGAIRTLDYGYDVMGNITSMGSDGGTPDGYQYDLAQQLISTVLGNATTDLSFDANGNRIYGSWGSLPVCDEFGCQPVDTYIDGPYQVNNLNQYTKAPPAVFGGSNITVTHDQKGNLSSFGSRSYVYDAQNRLTKVMEGATILAQYWYDGLNRQITRTVNGAITYHVWDGWNLIEERGAGNALQNAYLYGAGEIVENVTTQQFYFQELPGSTSHLSDVTGNLLEKYTYSGFGQPNFYNAAGGGINGSNYGVRHLFQGELWTQQTGLNDHRNRQALPALGIFLQPDPIGFAGDPSNLYRYCGGDPVNAIDPSGLRQDDSRPVRSVTGDHIVVTGSAIGTNYSPGFRLGTAPGGLGGPAIAPGERGGFFQGYENPDRSFVDTIPADVENNIVRAPPLGTPYYAPGVFPPGYLTGVNVSPGEPKEVTERPWFAIPTQNIGGFNIDAGRLAHIGQGFDAQGLRRTANAFNNYALGVSGVVAAPVFAPLALDALYYGGWYGATAATTAYQAALANPGLVSQAGQAFNAFITPGGIPVTGPSMIGQGANLLVNIYDPTFGP